MKTTLVLLAGFALAAYGEVVDKTPNGFLVRNSVKIAAKPDVVYAAIAEPSKWWQASHTWSGDSKNLTMDAKAGGCFCERLPSGGEVVHMTVIYADPGKLLRLTGAIGPLQEHAIAATLTFELKPSGDGTQVTASYSAGGYFRGGVQNVAGPVDGVMGDQLESLVKLLGKLEK
jgi:uncharacterized protein YndB with AHSA1/START domain